MFIKVAFEKGVTWYSRVIQWWTRGPYSHVELWLDGEVDKALCFSSLEGVGVRFAVRDLRGTFDTITVSENSQAGLEMYKAALPLTGKKYDWLGILGFAGPLKLHDSKDRFCSEVCYEMLDTEGFLHDAEARWKVSPNELADVVADKYGKPQRL